MKTGSISVAVCTDREASTLAEVLAALRAQGAQPVVVREASIAVARNRAAADCTAEVIAFVDDDVVVAGGWWQALGAAWEAAGGDVGAIGGPIAGARATLDYGAAALDLDPFERTLHAGNLSFRLDALRGVQGFWPARGRPGTRDWFGPEHHAQRELASAGWRVRYDPGAAATRAGSPDGLAARARYGARLQALGTPRPPRTAAATAAKAAAGAVASAVRGDRARAADRARRAAENVGVLLGPRLVERELEPAAASTPLRHSVAQRARRKSRGAGRALILAYHRIADVAEDPLGLAVAPKRFAQQLEVLHEVCRPVAVDELVDGLLSGSLPERAVAVTFDDGYADVVENAAPILVEHGVPATLYVATEAVARRTGFWWDEVAALLRDAPADAPALLSLAVGGERRAWVTTSAERRAAARRHIHAWLQPKAPAVLDEAMAQLRAWAGTTSSLPAVASPEQIAGFAATGGLTVGGHTARHLALAAAGPDVQRAEIEASRDALADWVGHAPRSFAYPFGVPGADFDTTTERIVAEAGFRNAMAMTPGRLDRRADRFALPRHVVGDVGADEFAAWLRGIVGG